MRDREFRTRDAAVAAVGGVADIVYEIVIKYTRFTFMYAHVFCCECVYAYYVLFAK